MCRARGLFEGGGEGDVAVLGALALGDADPAGVEVDVAEADADEFGDPDAGVEQGFDEHDVAAAAGGPDGLVIAADLVFGGDVGQCLGRLGDLDAEFGAQVPEDLYEVGVVGPFAAQVPGELAGLAPGWRPPGTPIATAKGKVA